MFGVLIEVSMSILKPVRSWLPRWAIVAVSVVIAILCGALWIFVKIPGQDALVGNYQVIVHLLLTFSAVRILYFLLLAGFSQLLSLGWRDRELQIATGLGFYSLATLSAVVLHNSVAAVNSAGVAQYHIVDQMVSAVYICSMIYWGVCFAQEVPERREFTPQMQSFILGLVGPARSSRIAMENQSGLTRERMSHIWLSACLVAVVVVLLGLLKTFGLFK
jgi:hypothetical protein